MKPPNVFSCNCAQGLRSDAASHILLVIFPRVSKCQTQTGRGVRSWASRGAIRLWLSKRTEDQCDGSFHKCKGWVGCFQGCPHKAIYVAFLTVFTSIVNFKALQLLCDIISELNIAREKWQPQKQFSTLSSAAYQRGAIEIIRIACFEHSKDFAN